MVLGVSFLCALTAAIGCGGDGAKRHRLSGAISCDGQPVAFGWIVFMPPQGPGASANIENGRYETPPGFGAIGGPHTVEVVVTNPDPQSDGSKIAPRVYRYEAVLPAQTTTWDIELDASQIVRE